MRPTAAERAAVWCSRCEALARHGGPCPVRPALRTARGRLTAYALACGYLERWGHVALWREHGAYHVARHPAHRAGWRREARPTLREARRVAAELRREATV